MATVGGMTPGMVLAWGGEYAHRNLGTAASHCPLPIRAPSAELRPHPGKGSAGTACARSSTSGC